MLSLHTAIHLAIVLAGISADDPRVAAAQSAYAARCTTALSSQDMSPPKAQAVCTCVASAFVSEVQFGVAGDRERYEKIMQVQPNPNGSVDDRHLYKIMAPCFAH
jgi:hypothetical protein